MPTKWPWFCDMCVQRYTCAINICCSDRHTGANHQPCDKVANTKRHPYIIPHTNTKCSFYIKIDRKPDDCSHFATN